MAVIYKNIKNNKYAYLSIREGKTVHHYYLGRSDDEKVKRLIESQKSAMPDELKTLFWDTDYTKLTLKKHSKYIIERILELGDLNAVNWLQKNFCVSKILQVLSVSRNISKRSKNFWENWFRVRICITKIDHSFSY